MKLRVLFLAGAFLTAATVTALLPAGLGGAEGPASQPGQTWPGFRGPNRDGICTETGLLKKWPEAGPTKVWSVSGLGLGWGTPSVAGGKIYGVGNRDGKDGVWALSEETGKELWFSPIGDTAPDHGPQTNGPASTPTVHNGKVYTVSSGGVLACMDAEKGKVAWTKSYTKDFGAGAAGSKEGPKWVYCDSVLPDGDKIICTPGGPKAALAALDAKSGKVLWTADAGPVGGGQGYSSPVKATIGGVPMYLILTGNVGGLIGVHANTGKVLWRYKGSAATGGVAQIPIPIVKDDLVWVSCSYSGGAALLKIVPKSKDAFEVKEIKAYKKPDLNNHHGGMVLVGDYIYFGHDQNKGYPVCVEFKTGEIKWGPITKDVAGGSGSAAVLYADDRVYFRYQNGVMVLIEPSTDDLKVASSFKLPAPDQKSFSQSWPHPVIANGKLYIRDQNALHCYNVKAAGN